MDKLNFVFKHDVETVLDSGTFVILKMTKATYNHINNQLNKLGISIPKSTYSGYKHHIQQIFKSIIDYEDLLNKEQIMRRLKDHFNLLFPEGAKENAT